MARHDHPSDEELLSRAVGGDVEGLDQLLDRHRDRLWRLLLRLTQGPQEAEDLLQETFVRVLRSYRTFAGRGKFGTWLYTVALNVFRSSRRKLRAHVRISEEPASAATGPAGKAEQSEAAERVRQAIDGLPENQRTAIVLSRYQGLAYEEIAEIERCSVDAVKQRVRRAMIALRRELRDLQ